MFKIFNTSAASIRKQAMRPNVDFGKKLPLLQHCLALADKGNLVPLATFIGSYLEFKRNNKQLDASLNGNMDAGLANLVAGPLMVLLEKQVTVAGMHETLQRLSQLIPIFYTQTMLDLTLREAAARDSHMIIPVLLDAGADVNAGGGYPLFSALFKKNDTTVRLLLARGANANAALALAAPAGYSAPFKKRLDSILPHAAPVENTAVTPLAQIVRKPQPPV